MTDIIRNGIDVYHRTGEIDWKKVKDSGISFAMCKASQGSKLSDPDSGPFGDNKFSEYVKGAAKQGIFCGAYHFLTGTSLKKIEEEINFFLKTLKKHPDFISYPCAVDMEGERYRKLSKRENTSFVKLFCEKVKAEGFIPMLYTNGDFYKNCFNLSRLKDIDIWFARYYKEPSPLPKPDIPGMTMFQWTSSGSVPGIYGRVDLNVCYVDYSRRTKGEPAKGELKTGDRVSFTEKAKTYWPEGPAIPAFAKKKTYKIIQTESRGKEVVKGGAKCVLLDDINTWTAVDNLSKV
ncbi:MAG: hypothetical protein GX148_01185 [Clostridiales bacterium]|jgi:GH25 family lysozyme M1 (1,4-beta-N-acetylmuramidase)|nr:hypothetical protein [Clostridiales bacterium]